ncbi:MAG TPA: PilZ domain-containing protein [Phycisphaerae bacterium]|nr:PilZ domain-containing protein [Phycisphaerae bacterium]
MLHVQERRRHDRLALVCPAVLRDKSGRVIFKGRTADISPCGIKVIGPPPAAVSEGLDVWVEMKVPNQRSTGPRVRVVKLCGYIRRVTDMGDWKCVIVVITEADFPQSIFEPRP